MKGTLKTLAAVGCGALLVSHCKKPVTPTASFVIESKFVTTGEPVPLKNTSVNAEHYLWTFPDGTFSVVKDPVYVVNPASRNHSEKITLTTYSRDKEQSDTSSQFYYVLIRSEPSEFFKLDTSQKKPVFKFIVDMGSYSSYRFADGQFEVFGGRIRIADPLPQAGEYAVDNDHVSIEMTTSGYNGEMPYQSKKEFGGKIIVTDASPGRIRIRFVDVRLKDRITKKVILASGDLTF